MSSQPLFPSLITTYQKVLLNDWPIIAKIIYQHSSLLKEGGYQEDAFDKLPAHPLSDKQIYDALHGPFSHFFLKKLHAFSPIARLRMFFQIAKEDSLKDNLLRRSTLDPKLVSKISSDDLAKMLDDLNDLVIKHHQQWEGQLFFWQISITAALKNAGLNITELESDDFVSAEPISELLARYDGVNITPIHVNYPLTFTNYFKLKAYLTILSALSRQHLPHNEPDIEKYMKILKKPFGDIEKAEKELAHQQDAETSQLIKPIHFAIYKKP